MSMKKPAAPLPDTKLGPLPASESEARAAAQVVEWVRRSVQADIAALRGDARMNASTVADLVKV